MTDRQDGKKAITIFTMGFAGKKAEEFFQNLREAGVRRVIDIRLNNVSQLAGFTKRDDLAYFLMTILGIEYLHMPLLAPTKQILEDYRESKGDWLTYEERFKELMAERQIEKELAPDVLDRACLLCSEPTAEQCHRRLVTEYLKHKWHDVDIQHL